MERFVEMNKISRTKIKIDRTISRKTLEMCIYKYQPGYIFRFKQPKFKGSFYVMQNEIIRDVEFLGYSFDRKFIPSKLT
jgi:hypothetical protein